MPNISNAAAYNRRMDAIFDFKHADDQLRSLAPAGTTVYCLLRHVSASGMTRRISFYAIKDNMPLLLDGYIADRLTTKTTDGKRNVPMYRLDRESSGLRVSGGGMDMGFHVVSTLAQALYGDYKTLNARWI